MNLKKLFLTLTVFVLLGTTMSAQTTWYVNNQIGNDGRNGLSATIPIPDDGVTGPKKTIGGAQGAVAESNAGDIIYVANTGVQYSAGTGDAAFAITKKLTFRSSGGTADVGVLVTLNNVNATPNNVAIFDEGAFKFSAGLTLTAGEITNSSSLITVSGTITRSAAAAKVNGQLLYSGTVDFSYGATMTTADEFVASGGTFRNLTTTAGDLTVKSGTNFTMTGLVTTAGTLNLGGGVVTITNSAGGGTHTIGGDVTNGTWAFQLGGAAGTIQTINGAFKIPNVSVTTSNSNAQTLAIAQPTDVTGTLSVSGLASVTTNAALVTYGTAGFTGDEIILSGTGTITLSGAATVHGNVLLNTALSTSGLAGGATITFGAATTVNGNVTNNSALTVTNAGTWNGMTGGRIVFGNFAHTITGDVVNNTSIGGATGATLDVDGFGLITFANIATNVTINGAINNTSNTTLSSSTNPADFSGNGLITFGALTTGIVRADGGINNSSNYSGMTGATNTGNGQITFNAGRTGVSTIGTAVNRVGSVSNSSLGAAAGDGNGDIIIGGDGTTGGFFGTSVNVSGSAVGGYTVFANESFDVTGNVVNSRTNANTTLVVGTAGTAGMTISIGGDLVNQGTGTTSFNVSTTGAVAVTGSVKSSANGTITWPNITSGAFTIGGLMVSSGTVNVPVTHTATITINGITEVSGGNVNLLSDGTTPTITVTGNSVSFTGGNITTTGVTTFTINSADITIGGATSNPSFATAATTLVIGNPTPTSLTTVTIGAFNPSLLGAFTVNNTTGLAEAVKFVGGTMNVAGALSFTAGKVTISDQANITVVGNFTNTAGYTTTEQGRVTVGGGGGQTFGGAGSFGTIEFNNAAGPTTSSAVTLTGFVYLTSGSVGNAGGAITISNSTSFPTIVRNAGSFSAAPTFGSKVNVTYIGDDKASGNELPVATDKLENLTVATTTGAGGANNVPSKGVVTIGTGSTVNGTITVNAGQTLLIDAVNLAVKGASIVVNGDIANEGVGQLVLSAATGTTISGSGYICPINVAAGSAGNVIDGPKAIIHQLYGTDNEQGGGDDFDPSTTPASGGLTLANGAASLTLTLSGVAFDGTDLSTITTNNASNSLVLGSNISMSGNIAHAAGTIDLGGFTLTHLGVGPSFTGGALTTNGTLVFGDDATTGATTLTLNTGDVTIAANVNVDLGAAVTTFTLNPATAGNLIISGDFTVTKGDVVLGNGATARNLTVTGSNVTLTGNGTIDVAATGLGTFRLNAATAPLTMTYSGTPSIARLRISNDVVLAGTGTALTVNTLFTHDGGDLNFGSRNLTIEDAFTRTAGTYTATTGYMILNANGATWTASQGADGFSIPNLRIAQTTAHNVALTAGAGAGTVTVTNTFDLVMGAQTFTTNGKLAVADGATVNYTSGAISAAPAYAGTITLVGLNFANGSTFPANIWPTTDGLVTNLTINGAAAANTIAPPGDRTVNGGVLQLTTGTLALGTNNLTLTSGITIKRQDNAQITKAAAGALTFPADDSVNVEYQSSAAGNGANGVFPDPDITAGIELPSTLNNLTITRSGNVGNSTLLIGSAITVNGDLTVRNDLTSTANISLMGNLNIAVDNFSNATAPVVTFGAGNSVTFAGTADQMINVPAGVTNFGSININNGHKVMLEGGNLSLDLDPTATPNTLNGSLTLTNGLLVTGDNYIQLDNPTGVNSTVQGFTRAVASGNVSHVLGSVRKTLKSGTNPGLGRNEFPVGSETIYRKASVTVVDAVNGNNPLGVAVTISSEDEQPTGIVGLPIIDGVSEGIDIARYPNFYWNIKSSSSMGQTVFDLELSSENFTDFANVANVRIIRRQGVAEDVSNAWSLQGTNSTYDNFSSLGTVSIVNVGATGGIRPEGGIFTFGLKTRLSAAPLEDLTINQGAEYAVAIPLGEVFSGSQGELVYSASSTNEAVATVEVDGDTLWVTGVGDGVTEVSVRATDINQDFLTVTFTVSTNPVGVEELGIPTEFALEQNYPNPFNPTTVIRFGLPEQSNVTLKVYNILGQEVATLLNTVQPAGWHEVNFNASSLSSGLYIYRIEAKDFVSIKKMMLVK